MPEQTAKAIDCIKHLKDINKDVECNYSIVESMEFQIKNWISDVEMINIILCKEFSTDAGDIYVRKIN